MLKIIEWLEKQPSGRILEVHEFRGEITAVVALPTLHSLLGDLKKNSLTSFDLLVDLTAVDWLERKPRFDLVYHLCSLSLNHRLRVKARVNEDEAVESVTDLWKAALWLEREVWDMFGIPFRNHPDLRRILMYPEFKGHPLRKDYPLQGEQPRIPYRIQPVNPWKNPETWEPTKS